ncbi:MAG: type II toxin-antitoxin system VapC family toxin [Firmicutes bacterium]|nr:type II toxin-antitoxin system VapC family toxin [Bacillota bacterium]
MILIDTNVLVYAVNTAAPQHEESRAFVEAARRGDFPAVLVPQVLLEFYAVVTGNRVEHPLAPETALEEVNILRSVFPALEAPSDALERLHEILSRHPGIRGGNVFDAWLAAQMKSLGIHVICTYNTADFTRYDDITAAAPGEILADTG